MANTKIWTLYSDASFWNIKLEGIVNVRQWSLGSVTPLLHGKLRISDVPKVDNDTYKNHPIYMEVDKAVSRVRDDIDYNLSPLKSESTIGSLIKSIYNTIDLDIFPWDKEIPSLQQERCQRDP